MRVIDMKRARLAPGSVFLSPEDLLDEPSLTTAQKIDLLERWKYDAREVSDATGEGMIGENNDMVHRVSLALEKLKEIS